MKTIDEHYDSHYCPECDCDLIRELSQALTDNVSRHIQTSFDQSLESMRTLEQSLRQMSLVYQDDKNARMRLDSFADMVHEYILFLNNREELLISIDNKLTDAFVNDFEDREHVYLCPSCHEQSCDHYEE